jgi:hypothetical protein
MAATDGNGGRTSTSAVVGADSSVVDGLIISFDPSAKPAKAQRGRQAEPLPANFIAGLASMGNAGPGQGVIKVGPMPQTKFVGLQTKVNAWLKVNFPALKLATSTVPGSSEDKTTKEFSLVKR